MIISVFYERRGIEMQKMTKRPVFLDMPVLVRHLPIPGIVSIMHRISGVVLFLMLPVLLALFSGSLSSGETFSLYKEWVNLWFVKLILWGLLWAFTHHLFAGIRFLILDMHIGTDLKNARMSARVVLVLGIVFALILGVLLW